jgi:hypothetical protein
MVSDDKSSLNSFAFWRGDCLMLSKKPPVPAAEFGKIMTRILATAATLTLLFTGSSFATPITRQIDFSFTGLALVSGGPAVPPPVDPVTGSFTITFDPTLAYSNQTTGLVTNSLNLILGSTAGFTYFLSQDILSLGGLNAGVTGTASNTFDFGIRMDHFLTAPVIGSAGYSQGGAVYAAGSSVTGTNTVGNLSFTLAVTDPNAVAVPEPLTLSLFSAGLVGAATLRRRKPN